MSRTYRDGDRRIWVHGIRKDPVDLRRLSRAVIAFAQAQAEAEAQAAGTATALIGKANERITGNGATKAQVTVDNKTVSDNSKAINIIANAITPLVDDDTTDDGDAA
jgi:hypothetical protein